MAGWMPVAWRAPVEEADRVLVLGATALSDSSPCRRRSSSAQSTSSRQDETPIGSRRATELGADATVSLEEDDLVAAFKESLAETARPTLSTRSGDRRPPPRSRLRRPAGASSRSASLQVRRRHSLRRWSAGDGELYGYTDFAVPKHEFREQYLRLVGHAASGEIIFDIDTYPLERIADAWERQATGANAKIVVTLR